MNEFRIETASAPRTKGEILFGIHSVHEALRANRRQLHRLFVKTNQLQLSDDEPSSSSSSDDRKRLVASVLRLAKERSVSIRPSSTNALDKLCSNQMHNVGRLTFTLTRRAVAYFYCTFYSGLLPRREPVGLCKFDPVGLYELVGVDCLVATGRRSCMFAYPQTHYSNTAH